MRRLTSAATEGRGVLSFFAAVATGLALAKSEVYRDPCGRLLRAHTYGALPPTGTTAMVINKSGATLPSPPPADALAGLAALRNATGAP